MEGQSGLSELSVTSWASAVEGCPLSGVPLYNVNCCKCICHYIVCTYRWSGNEALVEWNRNRNESGNEASYKRAQDIGSVV